MTTVNFDKQGVDYITRSMRNPIDNARPFFNILGIRVDQATQTTFRNLGARDGRPKWKPYSLRTLHPSWKLKNGTLRMNLNKWRLRPGTDGAKTRRYSAGSKLLQASTGFKKSFKVQSVSNERMVYGSRFNDKGVTAEDIIQNRPVLFVSSKDRNRWHNEFIKYYNKGLRF